jgi:hypothetical protein
MRAFVFCGILFLNVAGVADEPSWNQAILFHASFDGSVDAQTAKGDPRLYSAESLQRDSSRPGIDGKDVVWDQRGGRTGGALRFVKKHDKFIFFKGKDNLPSTKSDFEGTVSFWMRLSPDEDLPPGYVDPLQITDKKWNDASFFVDFTEHNPRQFRLGVFSDYKFWNPADRKWEEIPDDDRPLVTLSKPPFSREEWTHVAFVFERFNLPDSPGRAELYLDSRPMGQVLGKQRMSWQPDRLTIWLGINYVGWLDDLMVFDRALSKSEIEGLGKSQ